MQAYAEEWCLLMSVIYLKAIFFFVVKTMEKLFWDGKNLFDFRLQKMLVLGPCRRP